MKKILVILLSLVMSLSMAAGAFSDEKLAYKLSVGLPDSGATMFSIMSHNIRTLVEMTGGEVYFQGGVGSSSDAAVAFVENQIAAGADALFFSPPNDNILPTIAKLCEEAGVYWAICFRSIQDDEIREFVESSPYYLGRCYEDERQTGYGVMKNLNEYGIKKLAIISMEKGNSAADQREMGIADACKEFSMEIIAEARSLTQASDITSAAESFLMAYDDLDCIYVVSTTAGGAQEAVVKAVQDAGRVGRVYSATIDFPDVMDELFASGVLRTASGLASWGYDPYITASILINQVMGYPISDETINISMPMYNINDEETAKKWIDRFGSETTLYYSEEDAKLLIKAWNPDLTDEVLQEMVIEFTRNIADE